MRRHLTGYTVHTAAQLGWAELPDGSLISLAESHGYELLITTDQSIVHQQNLTGRVLSILVLVRHALPAVRLHVGDIRVTVDRMEPGEYVEIEIPRTSR